MEQFNEIVERQAASRARELGEPKALSNHAISRLTKDVDEEGRGISVSALGHYRTGRRTNPSPRTVHLLARALADAEHSYSELHAELQEAAGLPVGAAGRWILPDVAYLLSRREQLVIEELIRTIAALKISGESSHRQGEDED